MSASRGHEHRRLWQYAGVGVLAIFTLILVVAALTGKSAYSIRAETPTHFFPNRAFRSD